VDELSVGDLIAGLAVAKLSPREKAKFDQYRLLGSKHGGYPTPWVIEMRAMYRRHARRIGEVQRARERALITMAAERRGISATQAMKSLERDRQRLETELEDMGI